MASTRLTEMKAWALKKCIYILKSKKKKRYLLHAVVRTVYALNVVRELSHR
jgi:hypothetical protein